MKTFLESALAVFLIGGLLMASWQNATEEKEKEKKQEEMYQILKKLSDKK